MQSSRIANAQILLVEDDPGQALAMQYHLNAVARTTLRARSCAEARRILDRTKFDLVVLDIGLPDGTAFDVQAELQARDQAPATLFVTAADDADSAVRALVSGAADYIVKRPGFANRLARRAREMLNAPETTKSSHRSDNALALLHRFAKELFWVTASAKRLEAWILPERQKRIASAIRELSEEMADAARAVLENPGAADRVSRIELSRVVALSVMAINRIHKKARIRQVEVGSSPTASVMPQLAEAIINILDNAIRASTDGQEVIIRSDDRGVAIVDHGRGMKALELARCCEMGETTRAESGGHGVGLAVAKRIIESAGGRLEIDSEPGLGTTVRILLT